MNLITLIAFHPTGYELHIPVTFEELPATRAATISAAQLLACCCNTRTPTAT